MDAPPVRYAQTSDGYDIAFFDTGSGRPFVLGPLSLSDLQRQWSHPMWRSLFEPMSRLFRLITYDARGQGLSTRHLPEGVSMGDFLKDLEAVVDRLALERFTLATWEIFAHLGLLYAASHPERLDALILAQATVDQQHGGVGKIDLSSLAAEDWDTFLFQRAALLAGPSDNRMTYAVIQDSTTQEDWLRTEHAIRDFNREAAALLPKVATPTLVIAFRGGLSGTASSWFARAMPNAKVAIFDDPYLGLWAASPQTEMPGIAAIERFLRDLPERPQPAMPAESTGLSRREIEVLRLLAAGESNQQIADALVISLNTVRRHVSNIFDKTGAANRTEASVYARDHGLA